MARATVYLVSADVDERLSVEGATAQRTDTSGATTAVHATTIAACIDYACNLVDEYCIPAGYTVADLATSLWVKDRAIDLSVCRYRTRRGDSRSDGEKEACKDAMERLLAVRQRLVPIPDLDRPAGWGRLTTSRITRPRESQIWPTREIEFEKDRSVVSDEADDV